MCAAIGKSDVLTMIRSERRETLDQLVPLLYGELRAAARRQLIAHPADSTATLSTTALVNEAYVKLVDQSQANWHDRAHFLSIAAIAMRHILVDRARARATARRRRAHPRVTLDDEVMGIDEQAEVILAIEEALCALESLSPRLAQVVVDRFFGDLSQEETAEALGVTVRTVQRDWAKARVLLRGAIER